MSANRMRKSGEKGGPLKAILPISSVLRGPIVSSTASSGCGSLFAALSPPPLLRHISPPEYSVCGHRSPGSLNYTGPTRNCPAEPPAAIRRTASLDALYLRPSAVQITQSMAHCLVLQLDKSTQTHESYLEQQARSTAVDNGTIDGESLQQGAHAFPTIRPETPNDLKIDKILRQRLQQRGGGVGAAAGLRATEHSVSSQTLSPVHAKASPVTIPVRPIPCRPMRNSVEGLNQEIEKLVLHPDQPHTCRPETNLFSRGETPEGHRAPFVELLHGDRRSVNTQTPSRDLHSSDDSQSTSPEEGASSSVTGASPRINRFLAREPPDGCEKVSLKVNDTDAQSPAAHHFKPCIGFRLRPSLGSAFKPIGGPSNRSPSDPESEHRDGDDDEHTVSSTTNTPEGQ